MRRWRSVLSSVAGRQVVWLLVAALGLGSQLGLGSRAADRLASVLAADGPGAFLPLCGRSHHGARIGEAPPDDPVAPHLVCVLPAATDAPDLPAPIRIATARPSGATVRLDGWRYAGPDAARAAGMQPYPRGPPGRG